MRKTTKRLLAMLTALTIGMAAPAQGPGTERIYLSGTGCDDMVVWQFKCTDGRNAGQWTEIGVPSCWELQGFGTYQYGMRFYGKATPEGIADEQGLYRYDFLLPQEWQGRQIVLTFEAVMTDATVTINGRKAGSGLHQGGFTRFSFDVSDRIFFGKKKNRLEVTVAKESASEQVNMAERRADYWNFGGIWRPVFIEARPMLNIRRVAIDARADGRFMADVFLSRALPGGALSVNIVDAKGKTVATGKDVQIAGDNAKVDFQVKAPLTWTAETPNLHTAVFMLKDAQGKTLHVERQRFGFRTIEYRHSYDGDGDDGVFVNGRKVIMKGVNRHSFRPETGRTLSKAKNIEDVKLIKSMNMNAVRLSHYPADPEFLDACDSLGLYVECELPGWHWAHATVNGTQLVEEMVTRDVNHPSILFWSNGNEGGFNYELEPAFHRFDPQHRVVLYPWANRNGFETKHYRSWGETAEYMRQKEIFMPTEFLHGLYDGGHGAGLYDYWQLMMSNPRCAGGFLWDLQDQGVVRTDQDGLIDCMGNFGADGIVGPHGEKEASFYTIKEVWSPLQITLHERYLTLKNCYDFTNLKDCKITWKYLDMPAPGDAKTTVRSQGTLPAVDLEPHTQTAVALPRGEGDVLQITATGPDGNEIHTWAFNTAPALSSTSAPDAAKTLQPLAADEDTETLTISAQDRKYVFCKKTGRLKRVVTRRGTVSLSDGPRLRAAKRADRSQDGFYNHDDKEAFSKKTLYTEYADQGAFAGFTKDDGQLVANYIHGSLDKVVWTFLDNGEVDVKAFYNFNGVVDIFGISFDYPESLVKSKAWVGKGPQRVWQNRMHGPQYGWWQNDYNDPVPAESWDYPEFKGYFADVLWMQIETGEGTILMRPQQGEETFVGVYEPRDGRDHLLYDLPHTGLSLLTVIPAVRNKVNTTDLNGPSAQPQWVKGKGSLQLSLRFD